MASAFLGKQREAFTYSSQVIRGGRHVEPRPHLRALARSPAPVDGARQWRTKNSVDPLGPAVRLLAILLDAGGAQPGEAVAIDRRLPSEEFLDGERVAAACLYERQEPAANGCNDFGLAANNPALRP
jgi:hypothetical protein